MTVEAVIAALVEKMAARTLANPAVHPAAITPSHSEHTKPASIRPPMAETNANPAARTAAVAHLNYESTKPSQAPLNAGHAARPEVTAQMYSARHVSTPVSIAPGRSTHIQ